MRKKLLTICLSIFIPFLAFGQSRIIKGIISDPDGLPIPGATVIVKGTMSGSVSNQDGEYEITAESGDILVFSFVGMLAEEVVVEDQSIIDITLIPDIIGMDEVVVVGYGIKKQRDVIGSIAKVKTEELNKVPSLSMTEALQGKATGLQISASSGEPGARPTIKIRGISSINSGTDPLWIVDGVPIYAGGGLGSSLGATKLDPLSMINTKDIESIEVLKDAAATAIYGSRGANGVILVTTRKGTKGKTSTNIDYSVGVTELVKDEEDIGFANTEEYLRLMDESRLNSGLTPFDPTSLTNQFIPGQGLAISHLSRQEIENINTNWFDQILRQGSYHDLNISTTGGGENSNFYISLNYRKDESVIVNNGMERMGGRINLDYNPMKNITLSAKINLAYSHYDMVARNAGGATGNNSGGSVAGFGSANRNALPWYPIYDDDNETGYWNAGSGVNLLAAYDKDLAQQFSDDYRSIGSFGVRYDLPFLKGFNLNANAQYDVIFSNSKIWLTKFMRENGSYAQEQVAQSNSFNYLVNANYNRTFGIHEINAVAGVEWNPSFRYVRRMEGQDLTGTYVEIGSPQTLLDIYGKRQNETSFHGYLGRLGYTLNEKYLVELNVRRDGSSKFTEEYRWHTFYALSGGWIISDENFFSGLSNVINFLKFRGSYGERGNSNIDNNLFITTYSNKTDWTYGADELIREGTRPNQLGNPTITWETSINTDVGIDFGLLNNKISGSFAYYLDNVSGLLQDVPLPPSSGFENNRMKDNIGRMVNRGFEISLNTVNFDRNGFLWRTDINFTTNENEVIELYEGDPLRSGRFITKEGGSIKEFWISDFAGVDPDRGVELIYEIVDPKDPNYDFVLSGREIPATTANLDLHRKIFKGKTELPKYYGSLNNTFQFKGFDLSFLFYFSGGNYIYDYEEQRTTQAQRGQNVLRSDLVGNTWTPENTNAKYPQLVYDQTYGWGWDPDAETDDPLAPDGTGDWIQSSSGYNNQSYAYSRYLYKGDFVRLRSIQVGYNLPQSIANSLKINSLRIYLTGQNLWTWALEYKGWDPETGGDVLPISKIYSAGISVNF